MKRILANVLGLALVIGGEKLKELGYWLTPPKKVQAPDQRCRESMRGGNGTRYLRYCRRKPLHEGKHKDGDFEWGDGESAKPTAPDEEDIGQGEGCEGGKCAVRK
jgi:hypothetical protein